MVRKYNQPVLRACSSLENKIVKIVGIKPVELVEKHENGTKQTHRRKNVKNGLFNMTGFYIDRPKTDGQDWMRFVNLIRRVDAIY